MSKKQNIKTPLFMSPVSAGFPSPATDLIDKTLDLNTFLIRRPNSTFFVRVQGESMKEAGILTGDILTIDRAREARMNDIILAVIDSEFTVKRVKKISDTEVVLHPENENYKDIVINKDSDFMVWGVVVGVVRKYE